MKINQYGIKALDSFARIFTLKRIIYSFCLGIVFSWFTKNEFAFIFFGGKSFFGRSLWIQVLIVVILAMLYMALFVYLSHRGISRKILELSDLYWMLGSYLAAYFLYYLTPVFLNTDQRMWFSVDFMAISPIGIDLRQFLAFGKAFFANHGEFRNLYPPLFTLMMSPFASMDPASVYKGLVLVILLSYLFITLIIPALIVRSQKGFLLLAVIFFTGLFSYNFYFELERGQLNVVAFLLVLIAIYLFHYKPRFRFLAYMLFSIGANIKIYPLIFIFMFIDNWKDWKTNIKRFAGIGIFNLALLFVLGYQPVITLVNILKTVQNSTVKDGQNYGGLSNHSIKSFMVLLQKGYFRDFFVENHLLEVNAWAIKNASTLLIFMMLFVILCFFVIIILSIKRNTKGFNPDLFAVSMFVALLIPTISIDYALSILGSAVGVAFAMRLDAEIDPDYCLFRRILISLITFAYSTVSVGYEFKPLQLQNNLPLLMLMLLCFTVLATLPNRTVDSVNLPLK